MRKAMMSLLLLEMIAFALAIPMLTHLAGESTMVAVASAGGAAVLCLVAGGLFRTSAGYWLGWLAVLAGWALGLMQPVMFFIAAIFTALYVLSFVLGKKIDNAQPRRSAGAH
jgi:hypothetical protein